MISGARLCGRERWKEQSKNRVRCTGGNNRAIAEFYESNVPQHASMFVSWSVINESTRRGGGGEAKYTVR